MDLEYLDDPETRRRDALKHDGGVQDLPPIILLAGHLTPATGISHDDRVRHVRFPAILKYAHLMMVPLANLSYIATEPEALRRDGARITILFMVAEIENFQHNFSPEAGLSNA